MITIYLNDEIQEIEADCSLGDFLVRNAITAMHFALAINNQLITRSIYSRTRLNAGDRVDIIVPMQGG